MKWTLLVICSLLTGCAAPRPGGAWVPGFLAEQKATQAKVRRLDVGMGTYHVLAIMGDPIRTSVESRGNWTDNPWLAQTWHYGSLKLVFQRDRGTWRLREWGY
jgi:hypothetical protein